MNLTWLGIVVLVLIAGACITGFQIGFVKVVVATFFVLFSIIISGALNPYVSSFLRERTPVYNMVKESCRGVVEEKLDGTSDGFGEQKQKEFVDDLNLPEFIKKNILENNTAKGYQQLAANTFSEYIADYLTGIVMNGISFLITYFLARLFIGFLIKVLDILTKFPVVHGMNKLAGALVGGAKAILLLWIALFLLTICYNTQIGKMGIQMVEKDPFLSFMYDNNFLIRIFINILQGFQ